MVTVGASGVTVAISVILTALSLSTTTHYEDLPPQLTGEAFVETGR